MKRFALALLLCLFALVPAFQANAAFPEKDIKLIVPYAPGGASDAIFRIIAKNLDEQLGKPVVVVNMGGAAASKGTRFVKDSAPDGYTIGGLNETLFTAYYGGISNFTYKELAPICLLTSTPNFLVVRKDAPFNTLKELFDYAKANPGKLRVTYTPSSIAQVFFLGLFKTAGISEDLFHTVIINDTGAQIKSMLGGNVDLVMGGITSAMEYVKDGRLKFIGVANPTRLSSAPDVPTFEEQGVKWYHGTNRGIGAPKGTPKEAIDTIAKAFEEVAKKDSFKQKMQEFGCEIRYLNPAEYQKYMDETDVVFKDFLSK